MLRFALKKIFTKIKNLRVSPRGLKQKKSMYLPEQLTDEQKSTMVAVVVNQKNEIMGNAPTFWGILEEYTKLGIVRYINQKK
jgi:hypothetical protein